MNLSSLQLALDHHRAGRFEQAEVLCRQILAADPDQPDALNLLGILAAQAGATDLAIQLLQRAIAVNPSSAEFHSNLGNLRRATAAYRAALALNPTHPEVHTNLAMCLLLQGDFATGLQEYDWRLRCDDATAPGFPEPLWTGQPLPDRTLLLHAEQGLGDTIHFIRYLPLAAARVGRVIVQCQPALIPLLRQIPGVAAWTTPDEPPPPFDVHYPLLSLPNLFRTTAKTIPPPLPLRADPERVARWRARFALPTNTRKIGLAWAGNPDHKNDRNRSIPLPLLAPLLSTPHTTFVSLQVGPAADPVRSATFNAPLLIPTTPQDFADTAAIIADLDLVLTVDTAVAHLAGSMLKPAWLLLPFAPDWRWLRGRSDSPWYPTMKLFRQPRPADWPAVIADIVHELSRSPIR